MADQKFFTAPLKTDKMPPGIPYIIGNEAAERFNYYGIKAILVVFMTQYLRDASGSLAPMSESDANYWYHIFVSANYALPMIGALLADAFLGKYWTIIWLSLVYCLGSIVLAADSTRLGLSLGLGLIAIGSGGIKPCVSAHVGDQFGSDNQPLLSRAFGWFYFSVNAGALISMAFTPVWLKHYGPVVAFGVPAGLMLLATFVFWSGRFKFAHIPPAGKAFFKILFSRGVLIMFGRWLAIIRIVWWCLSLCAKVIAEFGVDDKFMRTGILTAIAVGVFWLLNRIVPRAKLTDECAEVWSIIGRISLIYVFVAVFWSLWDQSGGEWVLQAEKMDRHCTLFGYSFEVLSSQVQVINGVFILLLIPICQYWIYPAISCVFPLTPLRKIGLGLVVTATSFLISAWIEGQIHAGLKPAIGWQVPAYLLLSLGEVMVSITGLEFAYTQAPKRMKSVIMSLYLLAISAGNLFTALVQKFIQNADHTSKLPGAWFYLFFAGLCFLTAIVYAFVARRYREQTHLADETPVAT